MRIVVNFVWRIPAPSNVLLFEWRWNLDRLPTRDQLMKKGGLLSMIEISIAFFALRKTNRGIICFVDVSSVENYGLH